MLLLLLRLVPVPFEFVRLLNSLDVVMFVCILLNFVAYLQDVRWMLQFLNFRWMLLVKSSNKSPSLTTTAGSSTSAMCNDKSLIFSRFLLIVLSVPSHNSSLKYAHTKNYKFYHTNSRQFQHITFPSRYSSTHSACVVNEYEFCLLLFLYNSNRI